MQLSEKDKQALQEKYKGQRQAMWSGKQSTPQESDEKAEEVDQTDVVDNSADSTDTESSETQSDSSPMTEDQLVSTDTSDQETSEDASSIQTESAAETTAIGPFSSPVVIQLPESGKNFWNRLGALTLMSSINSCTILAAPFSSPSDISAGQITSTSFTLSWMAPPSEDHNGVIHHYIMRCTEQDRGVMFQRVTANATTQGLVDSLHPFYNYICTVAAVTIAEGPSSSRITVTTEQDGDHYFTIVIVL